MKEYKCLNCNKIFLPENSNAVDCKMFCSKTCELTSNKNQSTNLPERLADETKRERSIRLDSIGNIHHWWARRPLVLARVATYLAITQEQNPDPNFLADLGAVTPAPSVIMDAHVRIRDSSWYWAIQEEHKKSTATDGTETNEIPTPEQPRVLDPFGGGGAIPLEISRLGCSAYAGDINSVSYFILKATLEFPETFFKPDTAVIGTDENRKWGGLESELKYWTQQVNDLASKRICHLFPVISEKSQYIPDRYIWFHSVRCSTAECATIYPIQDVLHLTERPKTQYLSLSWLDGQLLPTITTQNNPKQNRSTLTCPNCSFQKKICDIKSDNFTYDILAAVRTGNPGNKEIIAIAPNKALTLVPWTIQEENRLKLLLNMPFAHALQLELPQETFRGFHRYGWTKFQDLFSQRQLLVALEYISAILETIDIMKKTGIPKDRIEALSVYLAFFIGYLADRNSKLCRWNHQLTDAGLSLERGLPTFTRIYVERSPFRLMDEWLTKLLSALKTTVSIRPAAIVYKGGSANLPFQDNYFDAVVADPPYYDRIPYSDLANFFWVWENSILSVPDSVLKPKTETEEAYSDSQKEESKEIYNRIMLNSFKEIYRVLKPSRKFCLFFTGKATQGFGSYVDLCQQAGFELINVRSLQEMSMISSEHTQYGTYLIYFRKPSDTPVRQPLKAAKDANLLEVAKAGKPVLYEALAKLIADELCQDDLKELLPPNGKGSIIEQLMEVLATSDPRDVLERCFGINGLRQVAKKIAHKTGKDDIQIHSPIEFILTHYGFALPTLSDKIDGNTVVRQKLQVLKSRISQSVDSVNIFGAFLDACSAFERLLRVTIWGWAQRVFGAKRDNHLVEILKHSNPELNNLQRLSFGHIASLFRGLPDHIALAPESIIVEQKFGRRHIYVANDKKKKFSERLDNIVKVRNKVDHNKDGYRDKTPLSQIREELARTLDEAILLLDDLTNARAIPRMAEPIQEIRDKWNRITYKLNFEDGTDIEACFSGTLALGNGYLYFGTETNPRPVDPLLIPISEIGEIP